MKKVRNGFIRNLHYSCLIGVVAVGLISGCDQGGDTTIVTTTTESTTTVPPPTATTTTTLPEVNALPTATIINPIDGSTCTEGDTISFSGTGDDAEDGTLTGSSLVWISSIDGEIGTGTSFTNSILSTGIVGRSLGI